LGSRHSLAEEREKSLCLSPAGHNGRDTCTHLVVVDEAIWEAIQNTPERHAEPVEASLLLRLN
jgi:hypothetical protein